MYPRFEISISEVAQFSLIFTDVFYAVALERGTPVRSPTRFRADAGPDGWPPRGADRRWSRAQQPAERGDQCRDPDRLSWRCPLKHQTAEPTIRDDLSGVTVGQLLVVEGQVSSLNLGPVYGLLSQCPDTSFRHRPFRHTSPPAPPPNVSCEQPYGWKISRVKKDTD